MAVFSLHEANRIVSAPGSRSAVYSVEDAVGVVRQTLAHLEREGLTEALFPALSTNKAGRKAAGPSIRRRQ